MKVSNPLQKEKENLPIALTTWNIHAPFLAEKNPQKKPYINIYSRYSRSKINVHVSSRHELFMHSLFYFEK